MIIKWGKLPKGEELSNFTDELLSTSTYFVAEAAPWLRRRIKQRLRVGRAVGLSGQIVKIPPYSAGYKRWLKAIGEGSSFSPDYSMSSSLLRSLTASVTFPKGRQAVRLVISPKGRINNIVPEARNTHATVERKAYSYQRNGRLVTVPAGLVRVPTKSYFLNRYGKQIKAGARYNRSGRLIYNAHLIYFLSHRGGMGRWRKWPTHHPLGISNSDLRLLSDKWIRALKQSGVLSIWASGGR